MVPEPTHQVAVRRGAGRDRGTGPSSGEAQRRGGPRGRAKWQRGTGRARAGLANPAPPLAQAPDRRGTRGGAAPRRPTASAPAAGRATAATAAAAAPRPAMPAQLVPLRAAEPTTLGRGQQGGFRVRASLGGVNDACPTGRALFRTEEPRGARSPRLPSPWSRGGAAREEEPALRPSSTAPPPRPAPRPAWLACAAR